MSAGSGTLRGAMLREALALTEGDRAAAYGDCLVNLTQFGALLSAYLGVPVNARDASIVMVLAKISRMPVGFHRDNYIDAAAYCAIAGEVDMRSRG